MKPHGFPRSRRLAERPAIRAVFAGGRYHRLGMLHAKTLASGQSETRYLISVTKAVGSAPERNRLKRLVRESVRLHPLHLPVPHDVCLFLSARPPRRIGLADVQRDLQLLAKRLSGSR
jgi:ribonuclease P protein component